MQMNDNVRLTKMEAFGFKREDIKHALEVLQSNLLSDGLTPLSRTTRTTMLLRRICYSAVPASP